MAIKKVIAAAFIALLSFSFLSCSDDGGGTQYYYWERFVVSKEDFNSAPVPHSTNDIINSNATFDEIKDYRKKLQEYVIIAYDHGSTINVTQDDIFKYLTSTGASPKEADEFLNNLETRGNILVYDIPGIYGDGYRRINYLEKMN